MSDYLFKDGSMIGLNDKLYNSMSNGLNRRLKGIGMKPVYDITGKEQLHYLGPNTGSLLRVSR